MRVYGVDINISRKGKKRIIYVSMRMIKISNAYEQLLEQYIGYIHCEKLQSSKSVKIWL